MSICMVIFNSHEFLSMPTTIQGGVPYSTLKELALVYVLLLGGIRSKNMKE